MKYKHEFYFLMIFFRHVNIAGEGT